MVIIVTNMFIEYMKDIVEIQINKIIISTWQSIYNQPKKWFGQFDMIVGDEAHLFGSFL